MTDKDKEALEEMKSWRTTDLFEPEMLETIIKALEQTED